jgi:hypothetical protein
MAHLTLTNAEIISALPPLTADLIGKADGGSTTTLENKQFKALDEESTEGAYICFLSGDNAGIDRIITGYDSSNVGTFTFDALDSAIDNTSVFAILFLSYIPASDRASEIIENDLRKKGYDIESFLTPVHLRELHLNRTIAHICQAKMQDADNEDTYYINYLEFMKRYEEEFNTLVADYDTDGDGVIEDDEDSQSLGQVVLNK